MICSLSRLNCTRATPPECRDGATMLWIEASHRMASGWHSRSSEHAGGLPLARCVYNEATEVAVPNFPDANARPHAGLGG